MSHLVPMRSVPRPSQYKKGDVLVLFGELFNRGYGNGIVEEAERIGMTIVRGTVGRRDKDGHLRALNEEEAAQIPKPFINVPLEAGFDLEPCSTGETPVDFLKDVKMSDWDQVQIDFNKIRDSQIKATTRFKKQVAQFTEELEQHIPEGASVLFVHLMAGGVPRARVVLPIMNRVFKGTGEKHLDSEIFWKSQIGQLCAMSFLDVTAETYRHLIEGTTQLRQKIESQHGVCRYVAYGYHGTEVLIGNQFLWQTYTPYLQGWAKIRLEKIAEDFHSRRVKAQVFNCPEILTNSSSIFIGVEVSLYTLIGALLKEKGHPEVDKILKDCHDRLKPEHSFESIVRYLNDYLNSEPIKSHCDFTKWPQHNSKDQMEKMLASSDELLAMHKDSKMLITSVLSELIFVTSGRLMLNDSYKSDVPVWWLGHDIIVKQLIA